MMAARYIDMQRKCTGVVARYLVKCEVCSRQNEVTVIEQRGYEPRFVCSSCGDKEPDVERIRR
jgi:uncharacterized Zn finger protein